MDIKAARKNSLERALSANEYHKQVAWAKEVDTDTPEDYIDRYMSVEEALEINLL